MTRATYVGTPDDRETETAKAYGTEFPKGEAVDVSHLAEHHLAKLRGNRTFVVGDGEPVSTSRDEPDTGPVDIPADWDCLGFQAMAALARRIDPTLDRTANKEAVMASIEAELGRRAAETEI